MAKKSKPGRKRYAPDVIAAAVDRALHGETHVSIAHDIGTTPGTVGKWVRDARAANDAKETSGAAKRIVERLDSLPPSNPPAPSMVPPEVQRQIDRVLRMTNDLRSQGVEVTVALRFDVVVPLAST